MSRRMAVWGLALIAGAGAPLVEGGAAGATTPTSSAPGVTAKTITVGQIDDISAPKPGLFAGAKVGTQAYFAYVNSHGGVHGRKLVLDARDSAFSSGTVVSEADSIARNDFAMVGGFSLLDGAEQPAIDAAKLPDIAQVLTPAMYADPNLYSAIPLVQQDGLSGATEGPFKWLKKKYPAEVKAVGVIGSNAAASAITAEESFKKLQYSLGYNWLYSRNASYTETTFLPDMIKMKSTGVKMVFEAVGDGASISTIAQEMRQQGLDATLVVGSSAYEKSFDPGAAGNGTILEQVTALYMGEDAKVVPAVATFDKWAKKVDANTQLDLYTLYGWINGELFVQALKAAGPNPTRASLDAQLNKITSFNAGGLISAQNPAEKIPGQCWLAAEYNNGNWHRISPDPKSGFVCNPGGFYPTSCKGIPRG